MQYLEYLIHAANVLYLVSYLLRDILWLRIVTVIAIITLMPYFYVKALYPPIAWNAVFLVINGVQIQRIFAERRPVQLDADQQRIYDLVFSRLTPREFLKLMGMARWLDAEEREVLLEQGTVPESLMLVCDGEVQVEREGSEGKPLALLGPGKFIGEMGFLTGTEASASVAAASDTRYLSWPRATLEAFLEKNPALRAPLQAVIGNDLVSKLRAA